ncbi:MAG: DUF817 domain-containing protein [Alphaproteobacteria bacterium]|nr:DUF817 domain-containing protein [Alphaproteobacteria bacterium]
MRPFHRRAFDDVNTRFTRVRARLESLTFDSPWKNALFEFLLFGFKQGWACLFGGLLLALLMGTFLFYPDDAPLARYDFLVLACIAIQTAMLVLRLETWDEAKVILAFHVVGTIMEIFKTQVGSWSYPEESVLRIAGVPLFSGFMYAAVGSYLARVTRIFDMRYSNYPPLWTTVALAAAIYANFFAHHYLPDIRLALFALTAFLFLRTWVWFTPHRTPRRMPLLLGFFLVSLFIWFAENLATFARAWIYPQQAHGWSMVKWQKLSAWYLLMIISFVLVSLVSRPREPERAPDR